MGLLEDGVVLVNGGGRGVGAGTVRAAAAEGATVVFTGRRAEAGGELQRGQRCRGGRLEDDHVARREHGRQFVQHEQCGVVERRDGHHDTARLTQREAHLVQPGATAGVQRQSLTVELGALEGLETDQVSGSRRLAGGLGDGLARLRADGLRDLGSSLVGELRRTQQNRHPRVRGSWRRSVLAAQMMEKRCVQ
jgi:hypothetical protein